MPSKASSAVALAGRLRSLDDAALAELLRARQVSATGIKDFFDLAERLLTRESIQASLATLDRPTLLALTRAEVVLTSLALTDEDAAPYDEVTATLQAWPSIGLPSAAELAEAPPPALAPVSATDSRFTDHAAAERAYSTVAAANDLVDALEHAPARELVRGGISLPDAKRLAGATGVALDDLSAVVELCAAGGLVSLVGTEWQRTEDALRWRRLPLVQRWAQLASGWFAGLPGDIRSLLAGRAHATWGEPLAEYVRWLFPANAERLGERMVLQLRCAELLGIVAELVPSTPGSAILAGRAEEATAAMSALLPQEVDRVFVQHDLTIVSPGPLDAPLDARLREFAEVESSGLATTYRVTPGSLNRALSTGATAESLRAFITELSLTGLPQPLGYLIDETARRHGLVRVRRTPSGSLVRSGADDLLAAIAVDQSLASLGLRRTESGLVSRFDEELVFWALNDARYPVSLEDDRGQLLSVRRHPPAAPLSTPHDSVDTLIERMRLATPDETEAGWLERQLEAAVKARTPLRVTVALPAGPTEMLLEPTGIGGGRLRARDRASDIERTLPLSSILEVHPAD